MTPEEAGRRAEAMAFELISSRLQETSLDGTDLMNPLVPAPTGHQLETILAHSGVQSVMGHSSGGGSWTSRGNEDNIALAPALEMATTYTRPADTRYREDHSIYGREDNPTRRLLELEIAKLECHGKAIPPGEELPKACAFASGMMAASAIILAHQLPLRVILPTDLYMGVPTVMMEVFARFHVRTERIDLRDSEALEKALAVENDSQEASSCNSKSSTVCNLIVWIESPSNPRCQVVDIAGTTELVKRLRPDATVVVDSTLSPPIITQPLQLGADVVMHSATKYIGGHSDLLLGVVTPSPWTDVGKNLSPRLRQVQKCVGGVAAPMDSWLALRGLRTLAVRVQKQCNSALQLAQYLHNHSHVQEVHYPGLPTHPYHMAASKQMKGGCFGGILSVEFYSQAMAIAVTGALTTIRRATSLGGTETLIEHRASVEPPDRVVSPPGLLRISVGLENVDDLIRDMDQAINIALQVLATDEEKGSH